MKHNKMWAMFNEDGTLYALICTVKHTRKQVITLVQNHFGAKWQYLYRHFGYRIEKVVVLRESEFDQFPKEKP